MTGVEQAIAAVEERLAKGTEDFHRTCLEVWLDEADWLKVSDGSRQQLAEAYQERYSAMCEGPTWNHDDDSFIPALSSDDYESLDQQEGWEAGITDALTVLRKLKEES